MDAGLLSIFRNRSILKGAAVIIGLLFGTSFLSGSGVMFDNWYAAPESLSRFVVMIAVEYMFVSIFLKILLRK